ncbi:MAG: hypothetical protein HKN04_06440 [Rhodothermaceae bacterium]|nr:hypothetical protein [Rhodothermaceae bacterium]
MLHRLRAHLAARRLARRQAAVTLDAARARVQRGAAVLDERDPGWHARISPATLELADGQACVLGQLHGDYRLGLGRARVLDFSSAPIASLSPVDLGFQANADLGEAIEALDYAFLTRAWREAIRERSVSVGSDPIRAREVGPPAQA